MNNKNSDYYLFGADAVLQALESTKNGLSSDEAALRLRNNGYNQLEIKKQESIVIRYFRQYIDPMVALLIVSSMLSFYLGDDRVGIVLLLLTLFNTTIGFAQEYKADKVMRSLEKLVVPKAHVIRNGALVEIASNEIVAGDVVYIEEGDSVPADLRVIEATNLSTNDFALTGESNPSHKFTRTIASELPIGGRHNLVYMGTTVATGNGRGVVIGVGANTELGRIASLSKETKHDLSPLQKEMGHIAKRVTQGTLILCLALLPIALFSGLDFNASLLFAIAIAASIIPQGLPAEISTALAQAASILSKGGALVKKLSSVETLGATTLICTDKTGTLTQNQMTVEQFYIGRSNYIVSGVGYAPQGEIFDKHNHPLSDSSRQDLHLFFATGVFASNATVSPPDDEHPVYYALGDPTEAALITLAEKAGIDTKKLNLAFPELREFSFDSARKRMSSVRRFDIYGNVNDLFVFTKGSPEAVLEKCTHIWDFGAMRTLTQKDRTSIVSQAESLATQAMRNLGFAYKVCPANQSASRIKIEEAEDGLVWIGMVSMIDPIRQQVPAAMEAAHNANVKVSIITGDHGVTASAIAARAGLASPHKDIAIYNGQEIQHLSDDELAKLAIRGSVIFSRVAPEDKLRIVSLAQQSGHVVAVTGDGINDAPALKRADIGVAMGKTGTDVAKQSADIVLVDDSFSTLVTAIQQGRTVFQNIKKATLSAFTSNIAELVVSLTSLAAAALGNVPLALSVMQILAIDLIAELFPIATLGNDKAEKRIMNAQPRKLSDHILNKRSITDLAIAGLIIGVLAFSNYLLLFARNGVSPYGAISDTPLHFKAMAITYVTIVLCQLANIIMRRSHNGMFTKYQFHNKKFWTAMGCSMTAVLVIVYVPVVAQYFKTGPLGLADWAMAIFAMIIFITIREVHRLIAQRQQPQTQ